MHYPWETAQSSVHVYHWISSWLWQRLGQKADFAALMTASGFTINERFTGALRVEGYPALIRTSPDSQHP